MSDSLTTLITKIQATLGDDGTIFTTATCTAALRQALSEWNLRVPTYAADLITGVNNQYEYELSDVDADAVEIYDVLQQGTGANELDVSLDYDAYIEDERLFFRLRRPVTTSDTLIVRYTKHHTINGLDSATESTIPARWNQAMVDGGALFSIFIRATSRVESINLSQDQTDNYREVAGSYAAMFGARMAQAARKQKPAVSEPDKRTWGDNYASWEQ